MTNKLKINRYLLLLFVTLIGAIKMTGQIIPKSDFPPIDGKFLIVDSAHVFSTEGRRTLEDKLVAFDNAQSTQILIVTIKDLGPYEIAQYATELGHQIGVGRDGKDNGIVILFSLNNRKVNISTGYGTEGRITDGIAGTIIREEMIPYFKQGLYEQGLTKGAMTVMQYLDGEYVNDGKTKADAPPSIFVLVFIVIIIIILMSTIGRGGGGRGGGQYMSRRGSDFLTGAILGEILSGGRSRGGGYGGGFGGGSSGGFGGFGGGGFGGGGASGSW
jgi:uncharacterized protein